MIIIACIYDTISLQIGLVYLTHTKNEITKYFLIYKKHMKTVLNFSANQYLIIMRKIFIKTFSNTICLFECVLIGKDLKNRQIQKQEKALL